jgi:protein-disulfide isomerase
MTALHVGVDPDHDHIMGPVHAELSLVEYADFQCESSAQAYWMLKDLHVLVPHLQIVYRHFPLGAVHRRAVVLAEAAQAAGKQGRFWQMHDLLFEHQPVLSRLDLVSCARTLCIDVGAFEDALESHACLPRIRDDFFGGVRSGVFRTPCLFINGKRYDGSLNLRSLMATLERAESFDATSH